MIKFQHAVHNDERILKILRARTGDSDDPMVLLEAAIAVIQQMARTPHGRDVIVEVMNE